MDAHNLPFVSEYAKSGRASCKLCKDKIDKDELRLGAMVQSAFHDGKQAQWYHERCFFGKQRPTTEGDVAGFESLRFEDQKRIREKIASLGGGIVEAAPTGKGKGKGKKRSAEQSNALKDFGVEYAASGRAVCRGCEIKILKDEVRIKKVDYTTEVGMKYGGQALWHHAECFAKLRSELGYFEKGEALPGYRNLKKEDMETVKRLLPAIKAEEVPAKKLKGEPKDEEETKQEAIDEALYAQQQKALFKIRDKLKDADIKKSEIHAILRANNQAIPEGVDACLMRVSDILTFGALKPCTKCGGQFVLQKSAYICEGNLTEWVKCLTAEAKPARVPAIIPDEIKLQFRFLAKYKSVVSDRVIKYVPPSLSTTMKKVKKEEELTEPKIKREKPPLYNLEFVILGKTETPKDQLKDKILKLGGKVTTKITNTIAAIISTPAEVERMGSRMQEAKDMQIQVVPEDYIEDAKAGGAISYITSKSICDWGSDPHSRIPQDEEKSKSKKSIYTKSVPSKVTLKLKGGLAVDPDSGLGEVAHVYKRDKVIFNCVLNKVDIQTDKNSYFKMQVLEADKGNKYWVFRAWGRIGTTIGGNKLDKCGTVVEATNLFYFHFDDKTGNSFDAHLNGSFSKRPGQYYPVDIDYGDEKTKKLSENNNIKSKLEPAVQDLVRMLFDVDTMKKVMLEFELDMEKMPLGKLSQTQLQGAMKVLSEISNLIANGGSNPQFIDASNRFYTFIPHNFGVQTPTVLDTVEQIKEKQTMLESLMEIEIAYSLLNADTDETKNPLDGHYEQLKTEMQTLDQKSDEFKRLAQYVKNTHAATHNQFDLEVSEIFKIRRKGEERRYKPFRKLHNRKLLWHGSRLTNFVGILTHGLKIAPPEAPVTGYMFGKGIYFADMVSKSANYCATSPANSTGLMLLCEVALGNMMELNQARYVQKLPDNMHSCKGVGKTQPNPAGAYVGPDGVEIPMGTGVTDSKLQSALLYNEYIVYDVAQVNCQYLFKMNFKYKY